MIETVGIARSCLTKMIRKLLSARWSYSTIVQCRGWSHNLHSRRDTSLVKKSLSCSVNSSNNQSMGFVWQPIYLRSLSDISDSRRMFHSMNGTRFGSNKNLFSKRNSKFLEFHESIKHREDDFTMSHSEWENLENEILTESPSLAPGLDYSIMKTLSNKPDLSVSFFNYIKSKREPNLSVITEFFVNCAEKYEDIVVEEYEKIQKTYEGNELLLRRNRIAISLAQTREWRQSIDLLDLELSPDDEIPFVGLQACARIFKSALKCKDYKTLFEVWTKTLNPTNWVQLDPISNAFYESWKEGVIPVDVLMELLKLDKLPLQDYQAREVQDHCNSKWGKNAVSQSAKVHRSSRKCFNCGEEIPEVETVDAAHFQKLCKEFLEKLLIGENIFKKTSPDELEYFCNFMKSQDQPFDYVVDGLNIFHKGQRDGSNQFLFEMLKNLYKNGNNILVITKGRQRKPKVSYLKWATELSLHHKTYDDCYMLLAAFLSGPKCYILTNDDFRDHIAAVDAKLKPYFLLWRDQRRIFHTYDRLVYPPTYKWTAHESETGWHIPYRKTFDGPAARKDSYTYNDFRTRSFLCIKKINYEPSPALLQLRRSKTECDEQSLNTEIS